MNSLWSVFVSPKIVTAVTAIVTGLSIGAVAPPDFVLLPVVGPVSGIVICSNGLISSAVRYLWVPDLAKPLECRFVVDCGCP